MKNKVFNSIVVIVSTCIFLSFFLFTKGLDSLIREIKTLNKSWILLAIILMLLFWFFETLVLYIITKTFYNTNNLLIKSFKFEMIGQFFGAITPLASGSHPAQLYAMAESKIPGGIAGTVLMIKFIIHQAVNIVILAIAFLLKFNYFNSKVKYFIYLCIAGFAIHIIMMVLAILLSINSKATKNILLFVLKVFKKFRIIKSVECAYKNMEDELKNFHKNAFLITKNIKMCIYASFFTFIQWIVFFIIPYCIYRSFGFNSADVLTMITAQIFLINFMAALPIPGAEGGAEAGFYLIYSLFFKSDTIITAIFIWRLLTYYSSIAIGSIFALSQPNSKNKVH
ncbi:lysylphosphatidylglycerol synthase transmembrane domain-containing protein [Clostridium sp. MB40-C1]|uniref:lysylphosphatidylglycerol synthase transmembrane domain-containing protein n=1 Tax=Clostridium sp. MB40-C1 TaxID=3070996 RepID=UPI0027DEB0B6|nr:lysylphosphatidylglycerol synthase transmembrane domain-containing protein [Clostridium sp. MB40-C1]WMJ81762.1 lysylphosphatidylglycerol synthase transmembrane domain-containing protein [Clostridium sp. MB40-C1]